MLHKANQDVSFFLPFHDLDPSRENRCIFFTIPGSRANGGLCPYKCSKSDNSNAVVLFETIRAGERDAVTLDQLRRYILYNCCNSISARHQHRMKDMKLLEPLCRRWLDEIRRNEPPLLLEAL